MGRNGLDAAHIIRNSVITLLVRPDIRAEWHGTGIHFEVRDEIVETCIVEPHPVDDGLVSAEAKQARLRISRLGLRRDGPALYKAEAKFRHGGRHVAILVESRGKTHRPGQDES